MLLGGRGVAHGSSPDAGEFLKISIEMQWKIKLKVNSRFNMSFENLGISLKNALKILINSVAHSPNL